MDDLPPSVTVWPGAAAGLWVQHLEFWRAARGPFLATVTPTRRALVLCPRSLFPPVALPQEEGKGAFYSLLICPLTLLVVQDF